MTDDRLYDFCRDIAHEIIAKAEGVGWRMSPDRSVFYVSDAGDLAEDIFAWLKSHSQ